MKKMFLTMFAAALGAAFTLSFGASIGDVYKVLTQENGKPLNIGAYPENPSF